MNKYIVLDAHTQIYIYISIDSMLQESGPSVPRFQVKRNYIRPGIKMKPRFETFEEGGLWISEGVPLGGSSHLAMEPKCQPIASATGCSQGGCRRSNEIQGLVMADQGRRSITPASPQAQCWGARVVDLG